MIRGRSAAGMRAGTRAGSLCGPRSRSRAAVAVLTLAVIATAFSAGRGIGTSLALLVSSAQTGGNVLTAGTWYVPSVPWTLHNHPTPPMGDTVAQSMLGMDTTSPVATTLFNYDADADAAPGRQLQRRGSGATETIVARYAAWRSPALTTATTISGTALVTLWSGTQNFVAGKGAIAAYVRDFNPSTGAYAEIASAIRTSVNWQNGSTTWVIVGISVPITSYTVPAGHQVELKLETSASSSSNMWIAYDTTRYASTFKLP